MKLNQIPDQGEHTVTHEMDVEFSFINEMNIMKPSSYQNLFAQLAERHLSIFGADANVTMKYGLSWALITISIEIVRPIDHCIRLNASTWYSQRKGPYFRRELVFRNEQGEVMFHGSTYSILMDIDNRSIYRKKEIPFQMTSPLEVFCIEADPKFRDNMDLEPVSVEERKVYNSYIDNLGHVNNQHYGNFAFDALSEEELERMKGLKRIDFHFISELRKNDQFTVEKSVDENQILVRGKNTTRGDLAFSVRFQF